VPVTLHSRAVLRACQLVGGIEELASRIGVSRLMVRAWSCGAVVPGTRHFLKIVDVISAESQDGVFPVASARQPLARNDPA
jgi:DNA-binding transcriptional regulator YdaS (Cro superfamily)